MADKSEEATNVMAFDALYTNNQIQKLKVLLPYMEPAMQKHLAVYIKYLELQYTLDYVKKHPFQIYGCSTDNRQKPDLAELCRQLRHYSTPEEVRQLEQLQNILQTLETFQEMSQTMAIMKDIFPDMGMSSDAGENSGQSSEGASLGGGNFSMMDMLMNMLTPEQKEMYEMFQNMQT